MTFMLRVGGIATRVVCDEPAVSIGVSEPGRRFLVTDGQPDVTIAVEQASRLADPEGEQLFDSGVSWRLYRQRGDFVFSFRSSAAGPSPYRLARFDASFTSGRICLERVRFRNESVVEPLQYPLDELLMINLLARHRGVEVHGCGVIDADGTASLFAGHSAAGKSTIARLWNAGRATVLSDDRVVLRLRGDQVWIYGTPWHGEEGFASPASAPLSRMFFLEHGRENRACPVSGAAAVARLLARSFPPFHEQAALGRTIEVLSGIVDLVPSFDLAFVPDSSVLSFIRERS